VSLYDDFQRLEIESAAEGYYTHWDLATGEPWVAEELDAEIVESNIFLGDRRWGADKGYVLKRGDEYLMVSNYEFDEGAEGGDIEITFWKVNPREVVRTEWVRST
jgi:hypothetical protein